jgi:hypothetical protein
MEAAAAPPAGHTSDDILPLGAQRARKAPERFSESDYSQWSAYDMSRRDGRHAAVYAAVDEARSSEPALAAELEALFSRVRATTSETAGADPASELIGEMERVAATTLHSALLEMLQTSGVTGEDCHIWTAGSSTAAVSTFAACRPDPSGGNATVWGELQFAPPSLTWIPDPESVEKAVKCQQTELKQCGSCDVLEGASDSISWQLSSFAGVNDDPVEHSLNQLRLLQGEDDGLLFGFETPSDVALFERTLRIAATSAVAAVAGLGESFPREASVSAVPVAHERAASQTEAPPIATAKRQKRTEEPRVRRGRELREALTNVAKLYSHDRTQQARAAFAAIPDGPTMGDRSILGRAEEMRSLLFTFGGLSTTKAALQKFLQMGEVQRLLSDEFSKTRQEVIDAETATELLLAAKRYINQMHARASGGRRSDTERNAFWAAVVSLMPSDLINNRHGRSMMRILGISYKT